MRGKILDLTNQRFGRLVVIGLSEQRRKDGRKLWLCQCDCGNMSLVALGHLRGGDTNSCGCLAKEEIKKRSLKDVGYANCTNRMYGYKVSAKQRGLDFSITRDQFVMLSKQNCYYCDSPPGNVHNVKRLNGSYTYNGIDRIDNTKGYIIENCVPCCETCNRAKLKMNRDEFLEWIFKVSDFQRKKGFSTC